MMHEDSHPSRQELLLAADGELSGRRATQIAEHLKACWECRARQHELEAAISDFVQAGDDQFDSLPPPEGPRALLKARLAELKAARSQRSHSRSVALAAAASAAVLVLGFVFAVRLTIKNFRPLDAPRLSLTPGVARTVTWNEVCSDHPGDGVRTVPAALRDQVFEEYGMRNAEPRAFEVDYLITPELGGAQDIRNLWPQPYAATIWNARVKDALEERLHALVCSGQLDLGTAQHDIAADWIAAYKKYFHTDRPPERLSYDQ
jgi:hypothetical protein